MKIISKSRIGMASDKLDCDEFMKNQNKIWSNTIDDYKKIQLVCV